MAAHPLLKQVEKSPSRAAEHDGWTLDAAGAEAGPVGVKADSLRLRRDEPSERGAGTLGDDIAKRAKYLLEPLEVVESDEDQALIRSSEPTPSGDGADYYEMWVKPDEISVERYHGEAGKKREPRPVNFTWEQAERFVKDVEESYDTPADE